MFFSKISTIHEALINRQYTCTDVVHACLSNIRKHQNLNAFIEVFDEEAIQQAKTIDEKIVNKQPLGKLFGIVISIKDVICYDHHTVSAASNILSNFSSLYTATALQKLIDEDAIVIGRTNCDEFAMGSSNENSAFGIVKNGIGENKVPGGSSGGSAVSVQMNMCHISLGTDTGGSVRQPADFCGIYGLKPSYGRVSRHGLLAYASSFDQIGIFSNYLDDVELVLSIISGHDQYDETVHDAATYQLNDTKKSAENNKQYKVAYFTEAIQNQALEPAIAAKMEDTIRLLKQKGCKVEAVDFPYLEYIVPTYYILTTAEASSNLARFDGLRYGNSELLNNISSNKDFTLSELIKENRTNLIGEEVKKRILLGNFVLSSEQYDAYFLQAQKVRRLLYNKALDIFNTYDVIISPTVPHTAFNIGEKTKNPIEMYLADLYTVFANLVGIPAISIPLFNNNENMPFGLQVMSKQMNEHVLFEFGRFVNTELKLD